MAGPLLLEHPDPPWRGASVTADLTEARDRELVQRIGRGDEDAFRGLFGRYAPSAMALARRVARQPFLAEEIVQEAFLAVWRNPSGYDQQRGSVRAWLMGMVHHRAVDAVRREESQRRRADESMVSDPVVTPDPADDVVDQIDLPEERNAVRVALDALPDEQRQVIELMYFGGLSHSAVSERLSLPLGTVKSRTLLGMRRLRAATRLPLYVVGVSLGGNVLLKWLGERGAAAEKVVSGAAAVSAPVDLAAAGDALGRGFNLVYTTAFLRTLKRKSLAKLSVHPGLYDARWVRRARTLRAFDDVVTAPLHGFADEVDYWRRASCGPYLARVRRPTLLISAIDDPFVPPSALPDPAALPPNVVLELTERGGHVGFVEGWPWRVTSWAERRAVEYLAAVLSGAALC